MSSFNSLWEIYFFAFLVSYKLIYCIFVALKNIVSALIIFSILKWDISRTCNNSHLENIELISVTDEVSIFDKSNTSNELHPSNIELISVTFEVSTLYNKIFCNKLHP